MRAPMPSSRRQDPTERMLIVRIVIAIGLALLLLVGAWSTSHGRADAHAALCLAPGMPPASVVDHHDDVAVVEVVTSEAGTIAVAALCGVLLVLLFRRLSGGRGLLGRGRLVRGALAIQAGPRLLLPALTLIQLCVSRS